MKSKIISLFLSAFMFATMLPSTSANAIAEERTFEELYSFQEAELKEYCSEHKLNYVSVEEAENQILNNCGVHIMMYTESYLVKSEGDLLESEDLSAFNKSNYSDYDFDKMTADLNLSKKYYTFDSQRNDFAFYAVSEPDENDEPKQTFIKLASIYVKPDSTLENNYSLVRLYQLINVWTEQNPTVYSVSLERFGSNPNTNNTVVSNETTFGTVKVTIIDEETNELFSEDRKSFSINGSGMNLDNWNPAESNPRVITDAQVQFQYMVLYTAKDYDGYTYYIDTEKCDPLIDFAGETSKDITIYMKKNYWGEPQTPNNQNHETSKVKSFDELYALDESALKQYCSDHKLNYISKEEAENQIANKCGINIMVKPNNYLLTAESDLLESDDLSAFQKSNYADYDFQKMTSDLQYPKNDYVFNAEKNDFAFYSESKPDADGEPQNTFLKLAQIHIDINASVNNERSPERLYQLMAIWAEQNPIVYSISLEKVGGLSDMNGTMIKGDVNNDGAFSISDVVLLQKWLLAIPDAQLINWKAADFCEDDQLNVLDLTLMKNALIQTLNG